MAKGSRDFEMHMGQFSEVARLEGSPLSIPSSIGHIPYYFLFVISVSTVPLNTGITVRYQHVQDVVMTSSGDPCHPVLAVFENYCINVI